MTSTSPSTPDTGSNTSKNNFGEESIFTEGVLDLAQITSDSEQTIVDNIKYFSFDEIAGSGNMTDSGNDSETSQTPVEVVSISSRMSIPADNIPDLHIDLARRVASLETNQKILETDLRANTAVTNQVKANTEKIINLFGYLQGFTKFVNWLTSVVKFTAGIAGALLILWTFIQAIRGSSK